MRWEKNRKKMEYIKSSKTHMVGKKYRYIHKINKCVEVDLDQIKNTKCCLQGKLQCIK